MYIISDVVCVNVCVAYVYIYLYAGTYVGKISQFFKSPSIAAIENSVGQNYTVISNLTSDW